MAAVRLVAAGVDRGSPDWTGLSASTVSKALGVLTDLGFVSRRGSTLVLEDPIIEFYKADEAGRARLFAERALQLLPFAEFLRILDENSTAGMSNQEVGRELSRRLGTDWRDGTAETYAKIMMDWARHTGLAPGVFASARKGAHRPLEQTIRLDV